MASPFLFNGAFIGAMGGPERWIESVASGDYTAQVEAALAFAHEVISNVTDPPAGKENAAARLMQAVCQAFWASRVPQSANPSDYGSAAEACITEYLVALADLETEPVAGGYSLVNVSGSSLLASNTITRVAALSNVATMLLPASPQNGDWVVLLATNATDWPITIDGNGHQLFNGFQLPSNTTVSSLDGENVTFVFDTTDGLWRLMDRFAPKLPPVLSTPVADANTVALWPLDPPGNGGNGLVDTSGNNLTLTYSGGGAGLFGEIGYGLEGALLDGTHFYQRTQNDPVLNLSGSSTCSCMCLPTVTASLPSGTLYSYGGTGASDANHNVLYNHNLQSTTSLTSPVVPIPNMALQAYFYQSGAAVGHAVLDVKAWPIFRPVVLGWVYDAVAATLAPYVNGFPQPVITGVPAKTAVGGAPAQRITIGTDSDGAASIFKFTGLISGVQISNVARAASYMATDAQRRLGIGARNIT